MIQVWKNMGLKTSVPCLFFAMSFFFGVQFDNASGSYLRAVVEYPKPYKNDIRNVLTDSGFSCTGDYQNKYMAENSIERRCWSLYQAEQCDKRTGFKKTDKTTYDTLYKSYECEKKAKNQFDTCWSLQQNMDCCNMEFKELAECAKKTTFLNMGAYYLMWESFFMKKFQCKGKTDQSPIGLSELCDNYQKILDNSTQWIEHMERCWIRAKLIQCSSDLKRASPNFSNDKWNNHFKCPDKPLLEGDQRKTYQEMLNYASSNGRSFDTCRAAYYSDQYDRANLYSDRMTDYAALYNLKRCKDLRNQLQKSVDTELPNADHCNFGSFLALLSSLMYPDEALKTKVRSTAKSLRTKQSEFNNCNSKRCYNGGTKDVRNCKCICPPHYKGNSCLGWGR